MASREIPELRKRSATIKRPNPFPTPPRDGEGGKREGADEFNADSRFISLFSPCWERGEVWLSVGVLVPRSGRVQQASTMPTTCQVLGISCQNKIENTMGITSDKRTTAIVTMIPLKRIPSVTNANPVE